MNVLDRRLCEKITNLKLFYKNTAPFKLVIGLSKLKTNCTKSN